MRCRDILHSWGKFALTGLGLGLLIGVTLSMAGIYRGMVDDAQALLSTSGYNALLYLALNTSTPINVTLVASSTPVFMLAMGAIFFKQVVRKRQILGAVLSIAGVLLVLLKWRTQG